MAKYHRLTNIDLASRRATCCICGYVKITGAGSNRKGEKRYTCSIRKNKYSKENRYRSKYGVEHSDRPSKCDVCGGGARIAYDHCHKTGKFRGWLCMRCNTALGLVEDRVDRLESLIEYLRK